MRRVSKRIKKTPERMYKWEGALEGWVRNTARKNLWKVEGFCTYDDLVQEGYLVYRKCLEAYGGEVNNVRWFMSLFQQSYIRHIVDLAKATTKATPDEDLDDLADRMDGYAHMELESFLDKLPSELKEVTLTFLNAPEELYRTLSGMWNDSGNKRRNKNRAVRQLSSALGFPDVRNLREEIHRKLDE